VGLRDEDDVIRSTLASYYRREDRACSVGSQGGVAWLRCRITDLQLNTAGRRRRPARPACPGVVSPLNRILSRRRQTSLIDIICCSSSSSSSTLAGAVPARLAACQPGTVLVLPANQRRAGIGPVHSPVGQLRRSTSKAL